MIYARLRDAAAALGAQTTLLEAKALANRAQIRSSKEQLLGVAKRFAPKVGGMLGKTAASGSTPGPTALGERGSSTNSTLPDVDPELAGQAAGHFRQAAMQLAAAGNPGAAGEAMLCKARLHAQMGLENAQAVALVLMQRNVACASS
eukprot:SAG31_NODE_25665_length_457_cov_0.578212_1_plen_146_part_10